MFHMADDSELFRTSSQIMQAGAKRLESAVRHEDEVWLPLYEGKLIHQFDHRFATFDGASQSQLNSGILPHSSADQKGDPRYEITPRYWVNRKHVDEKLTGWQASWLVGFRDVTSAVVERTAIFSLIPRTAVGHNCPLVFFPAAETECVLLFLGNLNSLVFDYTARQKLGGNHLTFTVLYQLPALAPTSYECGDREFINRRVLELVYTSNDVSGFAKDMGYEGPPFIWNEARRNDLRAGLDAYFAHLYGLTRDELRYILDPKAVYGEDFPGETFRVLKDSEHKRLGEYRTQRLVLEAFDTLSASDRFRGEKRECTITGLSWTVGE
jgi:hypothetical protein